MASQVRRESSSSPAGVAEMSSMLAIWPTASEGDERETVAQQARSVPSRAHR